MLVQLFTSMCNNYFLLFKYSISLALKVMYSLQYSIGVQEHPNNRKKKKKKKKNKKNFVTNKSRIAAQLSQFSLEAIQIKRSYRHRVTESQMAGTIKDKGRGQVSKLGIRKK